MEISAEDFLKQHQNQKKRVSALKPYLADIVKLRNAGLSLADVQSFLLQNGVSTSQANISVFLRRQVKERKERDTPQAQKPESAATSGSGNADTQQTIPSSPSKPQIVKRLDWPPLATNTGKPQIPHTYPQKQWTTCRFSLQ